MVSDDFQVTQTIAFQHMTNGVINAVADDLNLDAQRFRLLHKADEVAVNLNRIQMGLQLGLAHVQQGNLALHAFA